VCELESFRSATRQQNCCSTQLDEIHSAIVHLLRFPPPLSTLAKSTPAISVNRREANKWLHVMSFNGRGLAQIRAERLKIKFACMAARQPIISIDVSYSNKMTQNSRSVNTNKWSSNFARAASNPWGNWNLHLIYSLDSTSFYSQQDLEPFSRFCR